MLQYISINQICLKVFYTPEVFKIGIENHVCAGGTVLMYESLLLEIHLGTDS